MSARANSTYWFNERIQQRYDADGNKIQEYTEYQFECAQGHLGVWHSSALKSAQEALGHMCAWGA